MSEHSSSAILFVDDSEVNRLAYTTYLQEAGFQTIEAATGREALRLTTESLHPPDLVILDVNLPDLDGFEVCRRIKNHPATSSMAVLHLSGTFVRPQDKATGLEGGADGYLVKPVEPSEVVATVRALLRARRAEEAA